MGLTPEFELIKETTTNYQNKTVSGNFSPQQCAQRIIGACGAEAEDQLNSTVASAAYALQAPSYRLSLYPPGQELPRPLRRESGVNEES